MIPIHKLLLATGNQGKIAELSTLLQGTSVELVTQAEYAVEDAKETGTTFIENAIIKARHASRQTGLPTLADDSGLVVPALGGEPGIYSSRYAGSSGDDAANMQKLLERMQGIAPEDRQAFFYCVLVMLPSPDEPVPIIAEGTLTGSIAHQPIGSGGFGYDPLMLIAGRSLAEIASEKKNQISHRAKALRSLVQTMHDRNYLE